MRKMFCLLIDTLLRKKAHKLAPAKAIEVVGELVELSEEILLRAETRCNESMEERLNEITAAQVVYSNARKTRDNCEALRLKLTELK